MTRLPDPLTEPRHLAAAVAVGLILQAASLGAIGFAAAGDGGDGELPATLELPEPRVGDRGVYNVTYVEETGDGVRPITEDRTWMEFEWLPDRVLRDPQGRQQLVHRVHDVLYQWSAQEEDYTRRPSISGLDSRTWEEIAYSYATENRTVERSDDGSTHDRVWESRQTFLWGEDDNHGGASLCGLLNPFQGRNVSLDGEVQITRNGCSAAGLGTGATTFRPVGAETVAGHETVMFTADTWGGTVHLWLSPDLPVPVRVAIEDWSALFPDADDPDSPEEEAAAEASGTVYRVVRLVRFERGDEPIRLGEEVPEDPLTPMSMAPRHRYGPDETGVDHPFPLSEAWEIAKDNETIASYLDDHPDAYVYNAKYTERRDDDSVERRWYISVDDGEEGIRAQVSEEQTSGPGLMGLPGTGGNETDHRVFNVERHHWQGVAPPELVPDRLPSVAEVMRWWRSYRGDDYEDLEPNAWGFEISCNHAGCTDAEAEVRAGHDLDTGWDNGTVLDDGESGHDHRHSMLTVDTTGQATGTYEYTHRQEWASDGDPVPPEGSDDDDVVPAATLATPLWTFPAEHAGTIGLVAAITALLYWLWPAIKGVGLAGLRTRLTADEALDHPIRRELMDRIEAEPGVHRNELIQALDAGNGTIRHHLDKLVELDHVAETRGQGYACYFPAGEVDRHVMAAAPALRSGSARRVLEAVLDEPGLSNGEVAARTGLSPSTVSHHLARLQEAELVRADGDGRSLSLTPTEVAEQAVGELAL